MLYLKEDFEKLYRLYYPKMFAFAKNYVPADEDAENIVQDVFLALWERKEEIEISFTLTTYLFTLVKNRCLNFLRHKLVEEEYTKLVEGAVSVSCAHDRSRSYALQPRQQIVVSDHSSQVSPFENTDFMSWKEGIFIFDDMLLTDIIKKLELYYDVSILVKNTKLGNFRYTGKFRQRDGVESVLRKLQIVYPFRYTKDDEKNQIVLH